MGGFYNTSSPRGQSFAEVHLPFGGIGCFIPQKHRLLPLLVSQWSQHFTHAVGHYHPPSQLLAVVGCTSRDNSTITRSAIWPSSVVHCELTFCSRRKPAILEVRRLFQPTTQAAPTVHDHFVGDNLFLLTLARGFSFSVATTPTRSSAIFCLRHSLTMIPSCQQSSFIHQICQVCTCKARSTDRRPTI